MELHGWVGLNGEICLKIRVVPIDEKMRENRLRWFSHVQMRVINALIRKNEFIQVERIKKDRGRPKISLVEIVNKDMSIKEATENP